MLVAFEGMDGCGKSTIAKQFATHNNFEYEAQRIVSTMNIDQNEYNKFVKIIRGSKNQYLAAIFYTFRCMFDNEDDVNRVVERTMASTYYFEKGKLSEEQWNFLMSLGVIPKLTFVLYASPETRVERIRKRNPNDNDLKSKEALFDGYSEMIDFLYKYDVPFAFINTNEINADEVVMQCTNILINYLSISLEDKKREYLNAINGDLSFIKEKSVQKSLKRD